ncbi:MAG: cupin [Gammaproteobacteria bacterium]|nr:cupin [Gammaproteobacteria bacterium]
MGKLRIYNEDGTASGDVISNNDTIRELLAAKGVEFEVWSTTAALSPAAEQNEVIAAFQQDIDTLNTRYGFKSVDVVALRPDHPDKKMFREKFLSEHTHADFEVRLFVDGSGLFYLHLDDKVYLVFCEKGDLISVPANVTHWFDMGINPDFKCIRLFTSEEGWLADFTGSDIANHFPDYDTFSGSLA